MKFSICIPNFNYERYIGQTIQSVLEQSYTDFEILVSDNASTDRSVELIKSFNDPRIQVRVNACNVGFAGNLDRAGRMATGDVMIMLSSDDLLSSGTLQTYHDAYTALGPAAKQAVVTGDCDEIDGEGRLTGKSGAPYAGSGMWRETDRLEALESQLGAKTYRVPADELLRRCLPRLQNPLHFSSCAYPRGMYEAVEGYGGGRLMNPDKWFHWKLLSVAHDAYFIDKPLSAYRWHSTNQTAQQSAVGALKYQVDQYVSTLELDGSLLKRLGLSRDDLVQGFIEHDIVRQGLATLAQGQRARARRILAFGRAAYPDQARRNARVWALSSLIRLGPFGTGLARRLIARHKAGRSASENNV